MTDRMLTSRKVPNPCGPEMPRLLARIFSTLLEAGEDNRDAAVENGLKSLGEFLRVERSYVFLFRREDGEMLMDNTHEWCAAGVSSEKDRLQGVPVSLIARSMDLFTRGEVLNIPRVFDLPEESRTERDLLESQGILSALMVPLRVSGKLTGFLGFDAVHEVREWSDDVIAIISLLGKMFAGAFELWDRTRLLKSVNSALERRIADRTAELGLILRTMDEGYFVLDSGGTFLNVNEGFTRIAGYSAEELLSMSIFDLLGSSFPDGLKEERSGSGRTAGISFESRIIRKEGSWRDVSVTGRFLPETGTFAAFVRDITERVRRERAMNFRANHDPLTNLPNRRCFLDRLESALAKAGETGSEVAVAMVDLNCFKRVNDSMGHAEGDKVLREIARILSGAVRDSDTVARWGGDEFVILFEKVRDEADAESLVSRVSEEVRVIRAIRGRETVVTASIGVAISPRHGRTAESLLRCADEAMYRVKNGEGGFLLFSG
ncbi:MAG: diguanylate cyclase [Aminivibrio sp.]|uniref:diguanylate cyclase domain-containing protein n=1 Tax=Aminivibrio sp. TaxID=1872489 RepID=UPI002B2041C7|nr:diguanylate cyclase [Aminivibrio sp.]MEA4951389.1 diguanylate cyclase [Aminivibrio sp.]